MENRFSIKIILALFKTILHVKDTFYIILHNEQKFIDKFWLLESLTNFLGNTSLVGQKS